MLEVPERSRDELIYELAEDEGATKKIVACSVNLRGLGITAPHHRPSGPGFFGDNLRESYARARSILGKPLLLGSGCRI